MELNGLQFDIDIEVILQACGIKDFRLRGDRYRAFCPAHVEKTPSWDIDIERGVFNCFGCHYSGNVITLLTDFHPDVSTPVEALQWIFSTFNIVPERPALDIEGFLSRQEASFLSESILDSYDFRHDYLYGRGFDERTLQAFRVGWCQEDTFFQSGKDVTVRHAITIPWRDRKTRLCVVKYRPIDGSAKYVNRVASERIKRRTVFALDKAVKKKLRRVAICEGEFDAMYCWQHGMPAVALGGAFISREQVRELQLAGIREAILFLDNDEAGREGMGRAVSYLSDWCKLLHVMYPRASAKDANSMTSEEILKLEYGFL